jgi:hypothetical protein
MILGHLLPRLAAWQSLLSSLPAPGCELVLHRASGGGEPPREGSLIGWWDEDAWWCPDWSSELVRETVRVARSYDTALPPSREPPEPFWCWQVLMPHWRFLAQRAAAAALPKPEDAVVGEGARHHAPGTAVPLGWLHEWAVGTRLGHIKEEVAATVGLAMEGRASLVRSGGDGGYDTNELAQNFGLQRVEEVAEWRDHMKWLPPAEPGEGSTLGVVSMHMTPRLRLKPRFDPNFKWCPICMSAPAVGDEIRHDATCPHWTPRQEAGR